MEGISILEQLVKADPKETSYQHDLAMSYETAGFLYEGLDNNKLAQYYSKKLIKLAKHLMEENSERLEFQIILIRAFKIQGGGLARRGNYLHAECCFFAGIKLLKKIKGEHVTRIFFSVDSCLFHMQVADIYRITERYTRSLQLYTDVIKEYDRILKDFQNDHGNMLNQAFCYQHIGIIMMHQGKKQQALASLMEFVKRAVPLTDRMDIEMQLSLSYGYKHIATIQWDLGERENSFYHYRQMYRMADLLYQQNRHVADISYHFAVASIFAAHLNIESGAEEAAAYHQHTAVAILEELCKSAPSNALYQDDYQLAMDILAMYLKNSQPANLVGAAQSKG